MDDKQRTPGKGGSGIISIVLSIVVVFVGTFCGRQMRENTASAQRMTEQGTSRSYHPDLSRYAGQETFEEPQEVDLGLSVLWADRNIGADTTFEAGAYFAIGETTPKMKYDYETYEYADLEYYKQKTEVASRCAVGGGQVAQWHSASSARRLLKYQKGDVDIDVDVARLRLGDGWRLPTRAEWAELVSAAKISRGETGCLRVERNGRELLFPCAGYVHGDCITSYEWGQTGSYLVSDTCRNLVVTRYDDREIAFLGFWMDPWRGFSVRAVKDRSLN